MQFLLGAGECNLRSTSSVNALYKDTTNGFYGRGQGECQVSTETFWQALPLLKPYPKFQVSAFCVNIASEFETLNVHT
jgi:hypothetical protein